MGSSITLIPLFVYWLTCSVTATDLSSQYQGQYQYQDQPLDQEAYEDFNSIYYAPESWWNFSSTHGSPFINSLTRRSHFPKSFNKAESRRANNLHENEPQTLFHRGEWNKMVLAAINNDQPSPSINRRRLETELPRNRHVYRNAHEGDWRKPEIVVINNSPVQPTPIPVSATIRIVPPSITRNGEEAEIEPKRNRQVDPNLQPSDLKKPEITVVIIPPRRRTPSPVLATINIVPFSSPTNNTNSKVEPKRNGQDNLKPQRGDRRKPQIRFINNPPLRKTSSPVLATINIVPFSSPTNGTNSKVEPKRNGQENLNHQRGDRRKPSRKPQIRLINNPPARPTPSPVSATIIIVPPSSPKNGTNFVVEPKRNGEQNLSPQRGDQEKSKIRLVNRSPVRPTSSPVLATINIVPFSSPTNDTNSKVEPKRNGQENLNHQRGDRRKPQIRLINNPPERPTPSPVSATIIIVPPPSPTDRKEVETERKRNGQVNPIPQPSNLEQSEVSANSVPARRPSPVLATINIVRPSSSTNGINYKVKSERNSQVYVNPHRSDWNEPKIGSTKNSLIGPTPFSVFSPVTSARTELSVKDVKREIQQQEHERESLNSQLVGDESKIHEVKNSRKSQNPTPVLASKNIVRPSLPSDYTRRLLLEREKILRASLSTNGTGKKILQQINGQESLNSQSVENKSKIHVVSNSFGNANPYPALPAKSVAQPPLPADYTRKLLERMKMNRERSLIKRNN